MAALSVVALSTPSQAAEKFVLPPYVGAYEPQGVDERGLWMMADEAERQLRDSPLLIRDDALNQYTRGVLCKTVGEDRCKGVRIYILRVPAFNASMSPNGTMVIWSGLLLRIRNEAELGAVLGHEFAHFEQRHSLLAYKRQRSVTDLMTWAGIAGAGLLAQLSALDMYFSYSRDMERAADVRGAAYLSASPYRIRPFADIWMRQMDEVDATAIARKQRIKRYDRGGFFSSHPTSLERSVYLLSLSEGENKLGDDGAESYRKALRSWRATFLDDQVKINDFGGSEYLFGILAKDYADSALWFARGELYRQRGNPRDLVSAAEFYQASIDALDAPPEAWRGLGLSLLRSQRTLEGRKALQEYLTRKPDAIDAKMIAQLIG